MGEGASTLARLLGFLAPHRRRVTLAVALGVWTTAANAALLAVAAYLIALSALSPPLSALIPAVFVVQVLGGSRAFSRYAERLVSHDVTFGLLKNLRTWIYGRLEPLSPARLAGSRSGDLLSRMVGDVEELQGLYLRAISPLFVAAAVTGMSSAALLFLYPPLAAVALISLALAGVGTPLLAGALGRGLGRRQAALRSELDSRLVDGLWGVADLLAFGRAGRATEEVSALAGKLGQEQRRAAFVTGLREGLHDLVAGLATLSALWLAIQQIAGGALDGLYLALVALLVLGSFEAVRPLGEALQSLESSVAAGERLFEIADQRPAVEDPAKPLPAPAGEMVEFEDAGLRYGQDEPWALRGVSFSVERGVRVAVVGASGAGKSTLASLLLRFWDPDEGRVLLDGKELKDYAQADIRAALSVTAQDDHLFDGTVRENLLMARPEAAEEKLRATLDRVGLDDLPGGPDYPVGESGAQLSGGERRRLSVARALLKDAPVLVLDEPTADLDAVTERRLLDTIHEAARGKAMLMITHRLVGMERMDEILVLSGGGVAERGTHEALMARGGLYRRMVEAQDRILAP